MLPLEEGFLKKALVLLKTLLPVSSLLTEGIPLGHPSCYIVQWHFSFVFGGYPLKHSQPHKGYASESMLISLLSPCDRSMAGHPSSRRVVRTLGSLRLLILSKSSKAYSLRKVPQQAHQVRLKYSVASIFSKGTDSS